MRFTLFLPAVALVLCACSASTSNIHFLVGEGAKPRAKDSLPVELEQLKKEWARKAVPGVVVVGNVGALHRLETTDIAGWTSIETLGLAGFVRLDRPAAVRAADADSVGFAAAGGALFGTTGDLVAARAGADGVLVLDKVLCKEAREEFRACMKRFARGHFDQGGYELDSDLQPKRGGKQIDPVTYALLQQGGAQ